MIKLKDLVTEVTVPEITKVVRKCLRKSVKGSQKYGSFYHKLANCFATEDSGPDWSLGSAVLFVFTALTTIGYGHVAPKTTAGRLIFVAYALFGIPLTLVYLANIGKYLMELANFLAKRTRGCFRAIRNCCCRKKRKVRDKNEKKEEEKKKEEKDGLTGIIFIIFFILYMIMGTFLMPLYENVQAFDAFYFIFVTLTTIGFGDISPENYGLIIVSLIYISIGLSITSIAIETLSEYFKKLHYFGKKLENVGSAVIWFGGKKVTVEELLDQVAQSKGIELKAEDLQNLVETTVEIKEETDKEEEEDANKLKEKVLAKMNAKEQEVEEAKKEEPKEVHDSENNVDSVVIHDSSSSDSETLIRVDTQEAGRRKFKHDAQARHELFQKEWGKFRTTTAYGPRKREGDLAGRLATAKREKTPNTLQVVDL